MAVGEPEGIITGTDMDTGMVITMGITEAMPPAMLLGIGIMGTGMYITTGKTVLVAKM